tara:strand:- start:11 stop:439 length:429 start_codon:yes stop_codon:yes gene_type:complete
MTTQEINTTELSEAWSLLSDMHKDAYGFRPRNYRSDLTLQEINEEIEEIYEVVKSNMAEEVVQMEKDVITFNNLVAETIEVGAPDYETALLWLFDAFVPEDGVIDDLFCVDSFLYFYGIMHSDLGRTIHKKLVGIINNKLAA